MKKIFYSLFVAFICFGALPLQAQMNRTLNTKVADILAQMPTEEVHHANKLMQEIIDLDSDGIMLFCDMLVPAGTGNDTQVRYALQSLAAYAGGIDAQIKANVVEKTFIQAIQKANNKEVKTFLLERLVFCASNDSVSFLSGLLKDDMLYKPALEVLYAIHSLEASNAILNATMDANHEKKLAFIDALGKLQFEPAATYLEQLATTNDVFLVKKSLEALGQIGAPTSYTVLLNAAKKSGYSYDKSEAILAFIQYGKSTQSKGNITTSNLVGKALMKNCKKSNQLHFRSAGVEILNTNTGTSFTKTLIKEMGNSDKDYRGTIIDIAIDNLSDENRNQWVKAYQKANDATKPQILYLLQKNKSSNVFDKCITPAVQSTNSEVKIAGIKALAYQDKTKAIPVLINTLKNTTNQSELIAVQESLLRICNTEDSESLAAHLNELNTQGKTVLVNVWSARNATSQFNTALALLHKKDSKLNAAIYSALPSISNTDNLSDLLNLLENTTNESDIANTQKAIIAVIDKSENKPTSTVLKAFNQTRWKEKYLPVLPALQNKESLKVITSSLKSNEVLQQKSAILALAEWRNDDAIPYLFQAIKNAKNSEIRGLAFQTYFQKVIQSTQTEDQKLLLLRKTESLVANTAEKKQLIYACGNVKTFLSLVFVGSYLEDAQVTSAAAQSAIKIALPTPNSSEKFEGKIVRDIVAKSAEKLTGPDSQYIKIDIKEFLDNMSEEPGFVPIFNGNDLTGWEGLVENPIARAKMSSKQLTQAQAKANAQMLKDWFVKDGVIGFKGEGYNNICTIKDYADFEMLVDWKITNGGDSGIYLRGTPQVQIWDVARTDVGAQVGSGGLYNNQKHESKPLVVADNPINEWNTFRIKMVGDRVTVHLNGVLVTDNVILENYWDRKQAIFAKEAIELQAHGEDLGFRNVYVKEIPSGNDMLSEEEKKEGFQSLFNGKDLAHFIGNKTDYLVENQKIVVRPKNGGHGNLYTAEEYENFVFRFEFKLTPGANNGLGIHAPLDGDAAYVAKEVQILDNTADIYANLKEWQYHGSVYGIIAAKRGYLKPLGEWNKEEVIVNGDRIKVTLNGTVILDGNMKEAANNGTLDGKDHPGLRRNKGHIAFLGHGSELEFRNIRIKELKNNK